MKDLYSLFEKYTGMKPANVNSLTGSASNRSYFRMSGGESPLMGVVGTGLVTKPYPGTVFVTATHREDLRKWPRYPLRRQKRLLATIWAMGEIQ